MILVDSNVVIDALGADTADHRWAWSALETNIGNGLFIRHGVASPRSF